MENMNNYKIPLPSKSEQQQIGKYLDEVSARVEMLIQEKKQLLADLELYKGSLVYEVVTGKRKVVQ